VESLYYPAFFGGALTAMVLGLANGRRLSLRPLPMAMIAVAGAVAFAARIIATDMIASTTFDRFIGALAGSAVWGVVLATQRRSYRQFLMRGIEPASLWGPGLAAAIGLGTAEALIVVAATGGW
jgi:hypothetical protein